MQAQLKTKLTLRDIKRLRDEEVERKQTEHNLKQTEQADNDDEHSKPNKNKIADNDNDNDYDNDSDDSSQDIIETDKYGNIVEE